MRTAQKKRPQRVVALEEQPQRVAALKKQPQREISCCGYFKTTMTRVRLG